MARDLLWPGEEKINLDDLVIVSQKVIHGLTACQYQCRMMKRGCTTAGIAWHHRVQTINIPKSKVQGHKDEATGQSDPPYTPGLTIVRYESLVHVYYGK